MNKKIYQQLSAWLLALLLIVGCTTSAFAAEGNQSQVKLKREGADGNVAFAVENMFPGDQEVKEFTVKVSHKRPITLYYHADIQPGYEKLAEVMMVKVELPAEERVLYDGLMRDMPAALEHQLAANEKEVVYRITAYLDTSVGNEYQFKSLVADFRWWYMEEEADETSSSGNEDEDETSGVDGGSEDAAEAGSGNIVVKNESDPLETDTITDPSDIGDAWGEELLPDYWNIPKTGDSSNLELYSVIFAGSLTALFLCLIWMRKKRRKQEDE